MHNSRGTMTAPAILVLGAGAWGSALAVSLARKGQPVLLWGRNSDHIAQMQRDGRNSRYLPDIGLPAGLTPIASLEGRDPGTVSQMILAVPCAGLAETVTRLGQYFDLQKIGVCLACKGLAAGSEQLNHELVETLAGPIPVAVLSGPSFAGELAAGLPTAVTIASSDPEYATALQECFHSESLRIYTHDDVVGVEIGGAIKNVMAIAAGIADGLGLGANTRAALITRGLAEIMRLGVAMGGRAETFMGLAGLGDLVLTCTDDQSRNRRFGQALGRGDSASQAAGLIGQVVEGARTAAMVLVLAKKYAIDMPITGQVVAVIEGRQSPEAAVQVLLNRDPKAELD